MVGQWEKVLSLKLLLFAAGRGLGEGCGVYSRTSLVTWMKHIQLIPNSWGYGVKGISKLNLICLDTQLCHSKNSAPHAREIPQLRRLVTTARQLNTQHQPRLSSGTCKTSVAWCQQLSFRLLKLKNTTSKGLNTWQILARAELSVQLAGLKFCCDDMKNFSPGWNVSFDAKYEIVCEKSLENQNAWRYESSK